MDFKQKKCITDDGIAISFREYGTFNPDKSSILCLPGLTRNAKSFHHYALHCHKKFNAHLICPDMRGRGQSDFDKNYENYNLMRETQDIIQVIQQEKLQNIIIFGTSRGGMQSAMLAPFLENHLKGVILNDIGVIIPMGVMSALQQLFMPENSYVGNYQDALARFYALDGGMTQALTPSQEADIIESLYHQEAGEFYLDYDFKGMGVAFEKATKELYALNTEICDLRPLFSSLSKTPITLLHGENSKLLTLDIIQETHTLLPLTQTHTIENRGHCPYLNEAKTIEVCDLFINKYL